MLLQVVDQAAGGGHQHVDAVGQGLDLGIVLGPAEDHRDAQAEEAAVAAEAVGDLAGEFPGRAQHQHAATPARGRLTVGLQPVQDRQGEGRGLAGAGLGDAEQVPALHHRGDGLGLDRGGGVVAFGLKRTQQRLGQTEVGKLSQKMSLSDRRTRSADRLIGPRDRGRVCKRPA